MSEVNENAAVNDFAQEPQAEAQQEAPQQPAQPTQADIMNFLQAKNQMIQQLNINYKAFIDSLRTFPVMQGALQLAMQHMETGLVWMEKGISLVPFQNIPQPPVSPSQPQAAESAPESQPESDQANPETNCDQSKEVA
jgi:hypothetical protein